MRLLQRARWLWGSVGPCVLMLGVAAPLHAQAAAWRLGWIAPAGCPSEPAVQERIAARVSASETAPVHAKVKVTRRGGGFRVRIRLSGAVVAERVLDAESCEAAADATALLISLAIQPDAVATSVPSDAEAPSTAAPTRGSGSTRSANGDPSPRAVNNTTATRAGNKDEEPNQDEDEEPNQDEDENEEPNQDGAREDEDATDGADASPPSPWQLGLDAGLGVAFDWGTMPGPTLGGLLQVNIAVERLLLSLSGDWWLARTATIAGSASVSVGWMSASLDGCYMSGDALQLGPCLGVELGRYRWDPDGLLDAAAGHQLALFARAAFTGRTRLTNTLYASLWLSMRTSMSYPELRVVGVGEAFSPAALGLRAALLLTLVLG